MHLIHVCSKVCLGLACFSVCSDMSCILCISYICVSRYAQVAPVLRCAQVSHVSCVSQARGAAGDLGLLPAERQERRTERRTGNLCQSGAKRPAAGRTITDIFFRGHRAELRRPVGAQVASRWPQRGAQAQHLA